MLAGLLGCGLRGSELIGLEADHVQRRPEHWAVVDLIGTSGRIRTVPIPEWVKAAFDVWTAAAGITEGRTFEGYEVLPKDKKTALAVISAVSCVIKLTR